MYTCMGAGLDCRHHVIYNALYVGIVQLLIFLLEEILCNPCIDKEASLFLLCQSAHLLLSLCNHVHYVSLG